MTAKSGRKFWVVLALTLIPVTDFVGANWFYMRNTVGGWLKIALCILLLLIWLSAWFVEGEEAWGPFFLFIYFLGASVIWWLVDIFLVVLRKRL